jgi:PAS domain S-box-containing protein
MTRTYSVDRGLVIGNGQRGRSSPTSAADITPPGRAGSAGATLDEIEAVARIGSYLTDLIAGRWVSSKSLDAIFGIDAAFERSVEGWVSLVHPAEREAMAAYLTDEVLGRVRPFDKRYRIVRPDSGEERWVHGRGALELDEHGAPVRMFGTIADITEQVAAEEERALLIEGLRRSAHNLAEAQRIGHIGSWEWDLATDTAERSEETHRIFGVAPGAFPETNEAFLMFVHPGDRARVQASARAAIQGGGRHDLDYRIVQPNGAVRIVHEQGELISDPSGTPPRIIGTVQDITERVAAEDERTRLAAAVEQAPDAIGIADAAGTLIYANAALGVIAGRPVAELVGRPAFAMMGRNVEARAERLWEGLRAGHVLAEAFVAERPDGSTFRADGRIAPLRDAEGAITHFILSAHDVTHLREVEEDLALKASVRAVLAEALLDTRATDSLEEAIQRICDGLATLPEIDYAGVEVFVGDAGVVVLATHVPPGFALERGVALPPTHAAYVRKRVADGPWAEYWEALPEDGVFDTLMLNAGLKAMAIGPITHGDHVDGLLTIGTREDGFAKTLVDRRHALLASNNTTSALLAEHLHARRQQVELRRVLGELIAARTFYPVFQPIVDLASGEVVGYEALTRFESGQRPDLCFADAWSVGLGSDLELATLEAAVTGAHTLPAARWLSLNVSARLLEDRDRLREIIASADRPIVIEVTEHEVIADYRALRDAVRDLGHDLRVAVDDAGAGVANFGHIIELRPDLVKLDISIVRGVNTDVGRQALVVGMRHFSRTAGCRLVAEGVETAEEARALAALGVEFGQGYWFGRPDRAEAWASAKSGD